MNPNIEANIQPNMQLNIAPNTSPNISPKYFTQSSKAFLPPPPQYLYTAAHMSQWPFVKTLQPFYDKAYPSLTHLE